MAAHTTNVVHFSMKIGGTALIERLCGETPTANGVGKYTLRCNGTTTHVLGALSMLHPHVVSSYGVARLECRPS